MKASTNFYAWKSVLLVVILVTLNYAVMAQVDTTKTKTDSTKAMTADTTKPAPAPAAAKIHHDNAVRYW